MCYQKDPTQHKGAVEKPGVGSYLLWMAEGSLVNTALSLFLNHLRTEPSALRGGEQRGPLI